MDICSKLYKKIINILVTNICNLSCGGCSQQCGYISKNKLWNISLEQLKWNIDLLVDVRKGKLPPIGFFGGEPTLHPQYFEILNLTTLYPKIKFIVYSNGRDLSKVNLPQYKNIQWRIDEKDKDSIRGGHGQTFLPTQVAAMDVLKIKNKKYYWKKAQETCGMWNHCYSIIYNNKSYFCEIAACFDFLNNNGTNGWPLVWGVDPFLKSERDINEQATKFCYRCGWCLTWEELEKAKIPMQKVKDPTLITKINIINKNNNRPVSFITQINNRNPKIKIKKTFKIYL